MFCKSCGSSIVCADPINWATGRRRGICDRPVDRYGNHLRVGKARTKTTHRSKRGK